MGERGAHLWLGGAQDVQLGHCREEAYCIRGRVGDHHARPWVAARALLVEALSTRDGEVPRSSLGWLWGGGKVFGEAWQGWSCQYRMGGTRCVGDQGRQPRGGSRLPPHSSPKDSRLYLVYTHDSYALSHSFDELQLFDDNSSNLVSVSRCRHSPPPSTRRLSLSLPLLVPRTLGLPPTPYQHLGACCRESWEPECLSCISVLGRE